MMSLTSFSTRPIRFHRASHTLRPLEVASTILGSTLPLKAPTSHVIRLPQAIPPQANFWMSLLRSCFLVGLNFATS